MKQKHSFFWWVLPLVFFLMLFASVKLVNAQAQQEGKTLSMKSSITVEDPEIPEYSKNKSPVP